jgi:hypothetical protein
MSHAAVSGVLGLAILACAVCSCARSHHAATDRAVPPDRSPAVAPAASVAAVALIDNPNYTAELRLGGPCQHGASCTVYAEIMPKGDYHINDAYPYKFRVQESPPQGLSYPKPVIGRDDGQFQRDRASLRVPFSVVAPGETKVGGTLSLSVCSAANCLMDKQSLELSVKAD